MSDESFDPATTTAMDEFYIIPKAGGPGDMMLALTAHADSDDVFIDHFWETSGLQVWRRVPARGGGYGLVNRQRGLALARASNDNAARLKLVPVAHIGTDDLAVWRDDTVPGTFNAINSLADWEQKINIPGNGPYFPGAWMFSWHWDHGHANELWYQLPAATGTTTIQDGWRWCKNCQALHYSLAAGVCPAGGAHVSEGSGHYYLMVDSGTSGLPGQDNWRWCHQCGVLHYAGAGSGPCPAGGVHSSTGSGNYRLFADTVDKIGQKGWRWCKKCQALHYSPEKGRCPAGAEHSVDASGAYAMRSRGFVDALEAIKPVTMDTIRRFAPIVRFNRNEVCFPCSIEHILRFTDLRSRTDGNFRIHRPSQALLNLFRGKDDYYLDFFTNHDDGWSLAYRGFQPVSWSPSDGGDWAGHPKVHAPMYVAVQKGAENGTDYIDVAYAFLYAYQDGVTARSDTFQCILHNVGEHHGDLEHIVVRLSADLSRILKVGYCAHGETPDWYNPGQYEAEGNHAIVYAEHNSHASRCRSWFGGTGGSGKMFKDIDGVSHVLMFTSSCDRDGPEWRPFEDPDAFRIVGIDGDGEPIGSQLWAAFAGRIGGHQDGWLNSATTLWGTGLNTVEWTYLQSVWKLAPLLQVYYKLAGKDSPLSEDGPHGIADKPWASLKAPP